MRLVKVSMERKDHLVSNTGCEHSWPCFGKPAIIFHDRGNIFTSERARQVLVDRLGMITEQAPPYGLLGPPEKFTTLSPQKAQKCEISTSALAFRQPR